LFAGVSVAGDGEQVPGGDVEPATQPRAIEFEYPLSAVAAPLKVAVCPENTVCGVFAMVN
jgi:hypothetical protein